MRAMKEYEGLEVQLHICFKTDKGECLVSYPNCSKSAERASMARWAGSLFGTRASLDFVKKTFLAPTGNQKQSADCPLRSLVTTSTELAWLVVTN
jgi:hypothetical protein